ncbi:MAG: hypothetical protein BGO98_19460 [Myxococcales bacterium 68-20]|nr:hypothetical protein [Myxococcales bacterium]OJY24796.1 MAG: hypothetical protein BGO98_19460 [Myxococcales bacterium 68-20]
MLRRWLPLVAISVALLHAVPACMSDSGDTKLNPQPLPPGEPPDGFGTPSDGTEDDDSSDGEGMSPGTDAGVSADAGADSADAADSGNDQ